MALKDILKKMVQDTANAQAKIKAQPSPTQQIMSNIKQTISAPPQPSIVGRVVDQIRQVQQQPVQTTVKPVQYPNTQLRQQTDQESMLGTLRAKAVEASTPKPFFSPVSKPIYFPTVGAGAASDAGEPKRFNEILSTLPIAEKARQITEKNDLFFKLKSQGIDEFDIYRKLANDDPLTPDEQRYRELTNELSQMAIGMTGDISNLATKAERLLYGELYRGTKGKISKIENKAFDKVLVENENQFSLLDKLKQQGVKVPEIKSTEWRKADEFLSKYLKDKGYDAVEYKNSIRQGNSKMNLGEVMDLKTGEFYAKDKNLASVYSKTKHPATEVPKYVDQIAQPSSGRILEDFNKFDLIQKGESKVGKSIETKAIEDKLTNAFEGTAEYDKITIKDQARRANELTDDIKRAKRVLNGEEPLPEGLRGSSLITAMEDYAIKNKDVQLLQDIARSPLTSETSVHAQELRMLAERNPDSPIAAIQSIKKAREARAEKSLKGEKVNEVKKKTVKEIKSEIKKVSATKETWASFIDSIVC